MRLLFLTVFYSSVQRHFLMNICSVPFTTLYTEEDSHQGSKRLYL